MQSTMTSTGNRTAEIGQLSSFLKKYEGYETMSFGNFFSEKKNITILFKKKNVQKTHSAA